MNDLFEHSKWIYEKNADNTARFVLGERGENPLICIGVNPSTAEPGKLDPTLRQVKNRAARMGFDGWIMLNLYPIRSTDPNGLPKEIDMLLHSKNFKAIADCVGKYKEITVWCAWGTLIRKRKYLAGCLREIKLAIEHVTDANWITIGKRSRKLDPHHPLYLKNDAKQEQFDIDKYIQGFLR